MRERLPCSRRMYALSAASYVLTAAEWEQKALHCHIFYISPLHAMLSCWCIVGVDAGSAAGYGVSGFLESFLVLVVVIAAVVFVMELIVGCLWL